MKDEVHFGEQLSRAGQVGRSAVTSGPGIAWVTLFLLVPLLAVGVISFMTRGPYGEIQGPLTVENYSRFAGFSMLGYDPLYPRIILRSIILGFGTMALCVIAAFPIAFFIAGVPDKYRSFALTLVVIPFWTNLLIRTYAWQIMLAPNTWLANLAASAGWIKQGASLYPSGFAVFIGMLCAYLPFMVLPLYTAVEKIDWSIAEATMDLGANGPRVFRHAILPQVTPGLAAGIILVLIPAMGQFVIPDLLGGAKTVMLGNAIQQQFGASRDWPFGSAIAFLGMGVVMMGLWAYARIAGDQGKESLI